MWLFRATHKDGTVLIEAQLTDEEKQQLTERGVDLTRAIVLTRARLPGFEDFLAVDEQGRHVILTTV